MSALPVVAVVGRPNVGKSTLVNRFVGKRRAIVEEKPGVTRDRKELEADWNGREFRVVDTGGWLAPGFETADPSSLTRQVSAQAERAIEAADVVLLVVDATVGVTEEDDQVARVLQRAQVPVIVVANKVDDERREADAWGMERLGLGVPYPVSALHGRGSGDLLDAVVEALPPEAGDNPADGDDTIFSVAVVGRPNVGKSTLFNRLTRARDALVADAPGLTRDRRYGVADLDGADCTLVDTGGLYDGTAVGALMAKQAELAIEEADLVVFVVDAREGLSANDLDIASQLRRSDRPVVLAINKIDGVDVTVAEAEFARLGFGGHCVSAAHGRGVGALQAAIRDALPAEPPAPAEADPIDLDRIRVAVIGRPNVGKSTLINRWLGEERQIVFDAPGTTRDAIEIPFDHDVGRFTLIDTAGVRRKGKVEDVVEKFSVVKALAAIDSANVAVLVIDAAEGLVEQDLHLFGYAIERGAGIVLAVNKWDGLTSDARERVRYELSRRLDFAPWAPVHRISALHGTGVRGLLEDVVRVHDAGRFEVTTAFLARTLTDAVEQHPPPTVRGRRIKLRFAHKIAGHPPTIVVHGNQTESVPDSYTRYLENRFRDALDLVGMPVRVIYKTGANPYAGRRNTLTPRQQARRKRVMRHAKK
jgi:GTPase